MKIRIYSPDFPLPITEGAFQVIADQARYLSENHQVELVYWRSGHASPSHPDPSSFPYSLRNLSTEGHRENSRQRVYRVVSSLMSSIPSPARAYYPAELEAKLSCLDVCDLGIYHYSFACALGNLGAHGALGNGGREKKKVCYLHNLEADLFFLRAQTEKNPIYRQVHRMNARKLRRMEGGLGRYFDELWFISEKDHLDYLAIYGNQNSKLRTVPPSYDSTAFQQKQTTSLPSRTSGRPPVLGFLGKLDFEPNRAGAQWIIEKLAPALKRLRFDGEIWLGGKSADAELIREARAFSFIHFQGFVEDLDAWYEKIDVVLAPHLVGSGTRIKLLEALARRKIVLTHVAGKERISTELKQEGALIASDDENTWADFLMDRTRQLQILASFQTFPRGLDARLIYDFIDSERR